MYANVPNFFIENLEDANSTSEMSSFADWGSIISQVQDNLPAIDSDSEVML